MTDHTYGYWRTDKEKEPGYSHELISCDSKFLIEKGSNIDHLYAPPFEGVETLYHGLQRNLKRIPNHDLIGTRVGAKYEWLTVRDFADLSENLSYGIMDLNLAPAVEAEGKADWRFIGIQAKNRKEWMITNMANAHQRITTVAMYDTLGPDAFKFVLNQTELVTMAISQDFIGKLAKMKIEDKDAETPMCFRLANLIVFENDIKQEDRDLAAQAEITLYTLEEVIMKGRAAHKAGT